MGTKNVNKASCLAKISPKHPYSGLLTTVKGFLSTCRFRAVTMALLCNLYVTSVHARKDKQMLVLVLEQSVLM